MGLANPRLRRLRAHLPGPAHQVAPPNGAFGLRAGLATRCGHLAAGWATRGRLLQGGSPYKAAGWASRCGHLAAGWASRASAAPGRPHYEAGRGQAGMKRSRASGSRPRRRGIVGPLVGSYRAYGEVARLRRGYDHSGSSGRGVEGAVFGHGDAEVGIMQDLVGFKHEALVGERRIAYGRSDAYTSRSVAIIVDRCRR